MWQETGLFEIKKMNFRRRTWGAKRFLGKAGVRAATDQDAIDSLAPGASGKLANVDLGIASEGEHGWGARENQTGPINGQGPSTVTEK